MKFVVGLILFAFFDFVHSQCCGTIFQNYNYDHHGLVGGQKVCGNLASLSNDFAGYKGISSLKVDPGCVIEGYTAINFGGTKNIFTASTTNVGDAWNDKILSLKVRQSCCGTIYQNYNYDHHGLVGGQQVCGDLASLSADFAGYKGISSLKVDPGCVIDGYTAINFGGVKNIFTASTTNVGDAWNDKILSVRVRPTCCGTIFQNYNYDHHGLVGGHKVCENLASLSNDFAGYKGISSLKVEPGCIIEAFRGTNFAGEKTIFTAATTNVGDAWNDKILSVRVRPICCGTIFQNYNYDHHGLVGGQKVCGDLASLSADFAGYKGISSLKVDPGCVIDGFTGTNFAGGKNAFTASTTNVGDAWNDKILSLKVRPA